MVARDSNFANAYETTLTAQMGPSDVIAQVATTTGAPASPCYLVLDPDDVAKREYVFFDGTFTSTALVTSGTSNRYLSGSAAGSGITHEIDAVVRSVPAAQMFEDLHDRIDGFGDHGGLSGRSDDDHPQYVLRSLLTTQGDLPYRGAAAWERLGIGSTRQRLTVVGGVPVWAGFVGCRAVHSATQNIPDDAAFHDVEFDTETFDTSGFHDTGGDTTKFTIPAGLGGYYRLHAVAVDDGATSGTRSAFFEKNDSGSALGGAVYVTPYTPSGAAPATIESTALVNLSAGDYVKWVVGNSTGDDTLNLSAQLCVFELEFLGP